MCTYYIYILKFCQQNYNSFIILLYYFIIGKGGLDYKDKINNKGGKAKLSKKPALGTPYILQVMIRRKITADRVGEGRYFWIL